MAAACDFINGVPLWALSHLGNQVTLTRTFDEYGDGSTVWCPGSSGTLDAIQAGEGAPHAVVELYPGNLVNVPFEILETICCDL